MKLKGEYFEELGDSLDLVIIGGYFGEAKRATKGLDWSDNISCFLLGVVKEFDPNNINNTCIVPFVKVGTGYSQEELEKL